MLYKVVLKQFKIVKKVFFLSSFRVLHLSCGISFNSINPRSILKEKPSVFTMSSLRYWDRKTEGEHSKSRCFKKPDLGEFDLDFSNVPQEKQGFGCELSMRAMSMEFLIAQRESSIVALSAFAELKAFKPRASPRPTRTLSILPLKPALASLLMAVDCSSPNF